MNGGKKKGVLPECFGGAVALASICALGACGGDSAADASASSSSKLAVEWHPQSLLVTDGERATFGVIGIRGDGTHVPPLRYQWRRNGVDLPGETRDSLTLDRVSPADDRAEYTAEISDGSSNRAASRPGVLFVLSAGEQP